MIKTIKNGCLICGGVVKGSPKAKYFCKKCNILFSHETLARAGKFKQSETYKAEDLDYIGSLESDKYHHLTCMCAKNIKKENRIIFEGKKDAVKKGYMKCGMCNP